MTARLARRGQPELALVAMALLLPIPLLALSGLGVPLPSIVERGFASLLAPPGPDARLRPAQPPGDPLERAAPEPSVPTEVDARPPQAREGGAAPGQAPDTVERPPARAPRTAVRDTDPTTSAITPPPNDPPATTSAHPTPAPPAVEPARDRPSPPPVAVPSPPAPAPASEEDETKVTAETPGSTVDVSVGGEGVSVDTGSGEAGDDVTVEASTSAGSVTATVPGKPPLP